MRKMRRLQSELYLGGLMMGQTPKGVAPTRARECALHVVTPLLSVEYNLHLEVMNLLKEEIHLESLYPAPARSVRRNLIEVNSLKYQLLRVIPETKPDSRSLYSFRCFIFRLVHIHSRRRKKKEAPFLGGACGMLSRRSGRTLLTACCHLRVPLVPLTGTTNLSFTIVGTRNDLNGSCHFLEKPLTRSARELIFPISLGT